MAKPRIVYRNWAAEETENVPQSLPPQATEYQIHHAVHQALDRLEPLERESITRYYLDFEDWPTIASNLGVSMSRLNTIRDRALRRLRKELGPFVEAVYGVRRAENPSCPICGSERRIEIDRAIAAHDPRRPRSVLLRQLRAEFGIPIRTAHQLLAHTRYHS